MKKKLIIARIIFYSSFIIAISLAYIYRSNIIHFYRTGNFKTETVKSILKKYDSRVRKKFEASCHKKNIIWPPEKIYLLAFKKERMLEVWGANNTGPYRRLTAYPFTGFIGELGPKRQEGDMQIPEGIYDLTGLNPNSQFHLSVKIGYPNQEDIENAIVPTNQMGGDIFIHGQFATIGCIPIGDAGIEELFCLVAHADPSKRKIMIAPVDFRNFSGFAIEEEQEWVKHLYRKIEQQLKQFRNT